MRYVYGRRTRSFGHLVSQGSSEVVRSDVTLESAFINLIDIALYARSAMSSKFVQPSVVVDEIIVEAENY
jgi:hypothetical protein